MSGGPRPRSSSHPRTEPVVIPTTLQSIPEGIAPVVTGTGEKNKGYGGGGGRTLVLCFDGTSNEYDEDVSFVGGCLVLVLSGVCGC